MAHENASEPELEIERMECGLVEGHEEQARNLARMAEIQQELELALRELQALISGGTNQPSK